jgi:hypothetical protein
MLPFLRVGYLADFAAHVSGIDVSGCSKLPDNHPTNHERKPDDHPLQVFC